MALSNFQKFVSRTLVALGCGLIIIVLIAGYFVVRSINLERGFRNIYPDDSEAKLLEVVGAPTAIRECDERLKRGERKCGREYWYNTYFFGDGWIVPIDETGTIMQIRRTALP